MTNLINGIIGYKDETTYGTSAFTAATDVVRAFGMHTDAFAVPVPKVTIVRRDLTSKFIPESLAIGKKEVKFDLKYKLADGRELYYAMGKNTTTGAESPWTHALSSMAPSDGYKPTSRTFRIETDGLTTDKTIDVIGCLTESLAISGQSNIIGIMIAENYMAQRMNDENGSPVPVSIGDSQNPAAGLAADQKDFVVLTSANYVAGQQLTFTEDCHTYTSTIDSVAIDAPNDTVTMIDNFTFAFTTAATITSGSTPTLRSGVTEEDQFILTSFLVNATEIFEDIVSWTVKVNNKYTENYSNRSGNDTYGNSVNSYLSSAFLESKSFDIVFEAKPTDNTLEAMTHLLDNVLDTDITLVLTRTATNDEITITADADQCPFYEIGGDIRYALTDPNNWAMKAQPKDIGISVASTSEVLLADS